uniref:Uncharacterized protein n=1 Tax=Amphimedon queenslandica TaxID=400682 RepID=A0A1X7ULW5_AMPQE
MEKYFKLLPKKASIGLPLKTIKAVEREVEKAHQTKARGSYNKLSIERKTEIAKYAVENGIKAAVRKFEGSVPNAPKNWANTVRDWKDMYIKELNRKRKMDCKGDDDDLLIPQKKRRKPLLIGEDWDKDIRTYITALRANGSVVNTSIVVAAGIGIVQSHDANLLACNGSPLELSRDWAKSLLKRMNFVKRKATTKSSVPVEHFDRS